MRLFYTLAVAAMLSLPSVGANAFQESQMGGSSASPQSSAPAAVPEAGLATDKAKPVVPDDGGTKLSIPGLGTLGVIPKMDFGLELLYGSDNTRIEEPLPEKDEDGLHIRGTIKHRF